MDAAEQVCVLYAGVRGHLDKLVTSEIGKFEAMYLEQLRAKAGNIISTIRTEGSLDDKTDAELKAFLEDFMANCGLKMKA